MTEEQNRYERWVRNLLLLLGGIFTLGVLSVAFNLGGVAARLSFVPGISDKGGFVSALSYTVFLLAFVGIVFGGAYVSTDGLPVGDSGTNAGGTPGTPTLAPTTTATVTGSPDAPAQIPKESPTATETSTPTPTSTETPTLTPTPTPTTTPTPTPAPREEDDTGLNYNRFVEGLQLEIKDVAERSIHLKGFWSNHDNATLWVVMNGTNIEENWTRAKEERSTIAHAYRRALVIHKRNDEPGDRPLRLRFVDWNETSQDKAPDTFQVYSYDAWAYQNGTISLNDFFQRWFRDIQPAPDWVEEEAEITARVTTNFTLYPSNESSSNESQMQAPRSTPSNSEDNPRDGGCDRPHTSPPIALRTTPPTPVVPPQHGHAPA